MFLIILYLYLLFNLRIMKTTFKTIETTTAGGKTLHIPTYTTRTGLFNRKEVIVCGEAYKTKSQALERAEQHFNA